jgi:DNA-binding IclR family transcriptional regulator
MAKTGFGVTVEFGPWDALVKQGNAWGRMSKIVERTLDFLELFAEKRRPLSLSEIARLLNLPVSSCRDVLLALEDRGYIYEVAARSGYYPTLKMMDVVTMIADHDPVVLRAEVVLEKLRDTVDESVLLAKTGRRGGTYLLSLDPSHPFRFTVKIGQKVRNIHASSAGRAILAHYDPADLEAFFDSNKLVALTPKTITSKEALLAELEKGRARGWFANREESEAGLTTLSAPFRWAGATYIVTIAGPVSRMEDRLVFAVAQLLKACETLEAG